MSIISIEGNIGSGKSTLIAQLKDYYKGDDSVVVFEEPLNQWNEIKNEDGLTMLEMFYSDQKKYSFSFQIMVLNSFIKLIRETREKNPYTTIIMERSIETSRYVFAQMLFDDGVISKMDFQIYCNLYDEFSDNYKPIVNFYLQTEPDICLERIRKRNRKGEEGITIEYLRKCDSYHKTFF